MPKVGILMGSDSDLAIMSKACDMLEKFGIEYENANEETYRQIFDSQKENLSEDLIAFEFYNSPDKVVRSAHYLHYSAVCLVHSPYVFIKKRGLLITGKLDL